MSQCGHKGVGLVRSDDDAAVGRLEQDCIIEAAGVEIEFAQQMGVEAAGSGDEPARTREARQMLDLVLPQSPNGGTLEWQPAQGVAHENGKSLVLDDQFGGVELPAHAVDDEDANGENEGDRAGEYLTRAKSKQCRHEQGNSQKCEDPSKAPLP